MVLNKRVEFEVSELLANARETVTKLENTTTKMHDIIANDAPPVQTRATPRERRGVISPIAKLNTALLGCIVVMFSFVSISFYYFVKDMHTDVSALIAQVDTLNNKIIAKPPLAEQTTLPSHNSTK